MHACVGGLRGASLIPANERSAVVMRPQRCVSTAVQGINLRDESSKLYRQVRSIIQPRFSTARALTSGREVLNDEAILLADGVRSDGTTKRVQRVFRVRLNSYKHSSHAAHLPRCEVTPPKFAEREHF